MGMASSDSWKLNPSGPSCSNLFEFLDSYRWARHGPRQRFHTHNKCPPLYIPTRKPDKSVAAALLAYARRPDSPPWRPLRPVDAATSAQPLIFRNARGSKTMRYAMPSVVTRPIVRPPKPSHDRSRAPDTFSLFGPLTLTCATLFVLAAWTPCVPRQHNAFEYRSGKKLHVPRVHARVRGDSVFSLSRRWNWDSINRAAPAYLHAPGRIRLAGRRQYRGTHRSGPGPSSSLVAVPTVPNSAPCAPR